MIFPTEPQIKKKFFYKNMLADSSNINFLNYYKVLQQMKDNNNNYKKHHINTQVTQISLYKLILNQDLVQQIVFINIIHNKLFRQNIILKLQKQKLKQGTKTTSHKRKLIFEQSSLEITKYLEFLKTKSYSDILKRRKYNCNYELIKVIKLQVTKKKNKETNSNYYFLYLDIVNSCTHQYPNLEYVIDQLMQDIDIITQIYTSSTQLGAILVRITGIDYRIFSLLFRPKNDNPKSNLYFSNDEVLCRNFIFIKPKQFDIYYRIFGASEMLRNISQYLLGQQNKDVVASIDCDFVWKISFYYTKIYIFLKQKSGDILIRQQMNEEDKLNGNFLRHTILSKIIDSENQIGHFRSITRQNRYLFEKVEYYKFQYLFSLRSKNTQLKKVEKTSIYLDKCIYIRINYVFT